MKKWKITAVCIFVILLTLACKTVTGQIDSTESVITGVTLAFDSDPEDFSPVNPSKTFGPDDVIHAVVAVKGAPQGTLFTARWLAVDVGDPEQENKQMDVTETEQGGSGNLDFTLTPDGKFLPGTYRFEIYVDNQLIQTRDYSIVAGE